jgi:hypothetical protein
VTTSLVEHEALIWTFSTTLGLIEMSRGMVGEMFLKFPSYNTSCGESGTEEITTTVDGVDIRW